MSKRLGYESMPERPSASEDRRRVVQVTSGTLASESTVLASQHGVTALRLLAVVLSTSSLVGSLAF